MDRLQREISALREVVHDNVARFIQYEFSSKSGVVRHFLIEDFVEGDDLTVSLGKPWPLHRCIVFFVALADGLGSIHAKQIVHRDLKPSNIRVTPTGKPVIIDFGVARHLALPDITKTFQGAGLGTPLYFAPEQFRGTKRDIDLRTDLFALGVILHTAITGTHPFWDGKSVCRHDLEVSVCEMQAYQNSPVFIKMPANMQTLLNWLLGKRRSDRPRDCQQVINALNGMNQGA